MSQEARVGLVEQFYSTQGEGRNTGRPAVFVRVSGCNLACNFSDEPEDNPVPCDTPWMHANEKKTVDEIIQWAREAVWQGDIPEDPNLPYMKMTYPDDVPMMVFTGGEPTMQPKLDELVARANEAGFYTAIETNGTIFRSCLEEIDWVTVSPKDNVHQGNPVHGEPLAESAEVAEEVYTSGVVNEYRYVIDGRDARKPPFYPADKHYVSPGVISDGSGTLHEGGFPGFVPGALERCIEITQDDWRWSISIQAHKVMGVR